MTFQQKLKFWRDRRVRNFKQRWPWMLSWPWILEKRLRDEEYKARVFRGSLDVAQRELEQLKARFDDVLPKLVQVRVGYAPVPSVYRIQLDMPHDMISRAFAFGDDQQMIRIFGERVGRMVERELRTANLHRFQDKRYLEPPAPWDRGLF